MAMKSMFGLEAREASLGRVRAPVPTASRTQSVNHIGGSILPEKQV
jgi:hypothetical protein